MRKPTFRANFTKKYLEGLKPPESGRLVVYDSHTAGLGVRVEANGRRSLFWFRKVNGNPTFRAIGAVTDVSVEKAREQATEWSGRLAEWKRNGFRGDDPFEQPKGEPTFGELADSYIEKRVKQHAAHPDKAAKAVRWMVDLYLPAWKNRKLSTIRRKDVLDLQSELAEERGHVTANRVCQLVRRIYFWAAGDGELYDGENPARRIKFFYEPKRTRVLSRDEIAGLFAALKKAPNPDLADFAFIALFTGARKGDVMSMAWQNVFLKDHRWEIPHPKGRKPYQVPLVPEVLEILKRRQAEAKAGTAFVFPGHGRTGHVTDLKGAWAKVLKDAGISGVTQHDLRRTYASTQTQQGTSLQVVGASLGHASLDATQVYSVVDFKSVAASARKATKTMMAAARRKSRQLRAVGQ